MRFKAVLCAGIFVSTAVIPAAFAQAAANTPQIASHARQAQDFLRKGQPDLATREYEAILKLDPNNVDARGNLGVALFFKAEYANAATNLRAALKQRPNLWKIEALLGMSEKRIGQTAAAEADLEKSFPQLQEGKLRVQAGTELIELDYGAGKLDKAAVLVATLRQLAPENTEIIYIAYRIYSDLAGESMLAMAMLAPKSARMHQIMGQETSRHEDIKAAVAHYREAVQLDPQLPGLRFELAEALNLSGSAGDQEQVEKEYRAALADNPFDEKSECRLGDIALRSSDVPQALSHYQRAIELQPSDAEANLGLGRVLTQMHRLPEAEKYLKRAAQLEPFTSVTHYRLSLIYRATGRTEEAEKELAEFQHLKEMKERLKQVYQEMRLRPLKEEDADAEK